MLKELNIKNFAIIEDLHIPFNKGFNVLTGETGAGKSIIIEALSLVIGEKASSEFIRSGEKQAHVVAVFDRSRLQLNADILKTSIINKNDLIIKRVIFTSGRSKIFINGESATIHDLRKLSPYLLEISSQHENQQLLLADTHLRVVDMYGALMVDRSKYKEMFDLYCALNSRKKELEKLRDEKQEQQEYLKFQINEIEIASIKPLEDEVLERERNISKYRARLFENMHSADLTLSSSDGSMCSALSRVRTNLEQACLIDNSISEFMKVYEEAEVALYELSRLVQSYISGDNVSTGRLDEIENRLFEIKRLKKKYGPSIEDISEVLKGLKERLSLLENCDEEIKKNSIELKKAKDALEAQAKLLSEKRKKSAEKLSLEIEKELATLKLDKTTFGPGHKRSNLEDALESGIDSFNFMISPNPGEPLKSLVKIASGGELSRVMLAIKKVLMDRVGLAGLHVFDEVDAGIGGAVAEVVGKKLKYMSEKKQIICITHLPQVASFADDHIVVSKFTDKQRTITGFKLLKKDERVDEIARMLGGEKITKTTKKHASELLKDNSSY